MSRKKESVTLSITESDKIAIERLALEFNCTWGDKPNISRLIKSIAHGNLLVSKANKPTKEECILIKDAIFKIQDGLSILLKLI